MDNYQQEVSTMQQYVPAVRKSNLELYRIFLMLAIIAHHYVVNSGLIGNISLSSYSLQTNFLLLIGAWGKTGINCFVLITGYFMCKSKFSLIKLLKLVLEIEFYNCLLYFIFCGTHYLTFNVKEFLYVLMPIKGVSDGFVSCFLCFFLLLPFLNIFAKSLSKRQHLSFIAVLIFIYTILPSLPFRSIRIIVVFNYITWFVILYFLASYIRLHPEKWFSSIKLWGLLSLGSVIFSCATIIFFHTLRKNFNFNFFDEYFFLYDSNKICSLLVAVTTFMFFKEIPIKHSKFINEVAKTVFGILLIHANSGTMRQWLWGDFLKNTTYFGSDFIYLHAIVSVIGVFAVCAMIDYIRILLIEKPLFQYLNKKLATWNGEPKDS